MAKDKTKRNKRKPDLDYDPHRKYTKRYLKLLKTYTNQINDAIDQRYDLKNKFFKRISIMMSILGVFFILSISVSFCLFWIMTVNDFKSTSIVVGSITGMLSSFATMFLSIFKLPKIIAKYLFNKKEDYTMNKIIKNIQKYEVRSVRLDKLSSLKRLMWEDRIAHKENRHSADIFPDDDGNSATANVQSGISNSVQTNESGSIPDDTLEIIPVDGFSIIPGDVLQTDTSSPAEDIASNDMAINLSDGAQNNEPCDPTAPT